MTNSSNIRQFRARDPADRRLAVLIDSDNAQPSIVQELLAEAARYGTANVKRAYGDWTTQNLNGWKPLLHRHAIQPIQQFRNTTGKNAADSALIIDAMDLLHSGDLDGFCLVSSDSDFTRLATRIRESGLLVCGFGEKKTPEAFVSACDRFIYTEILAQGDHLKVQQSESPDVLEPLIRAAVTSAIRDDGWAPLSAVGSVIAKQRPSFDSRMFGYPKLGDLVRNLTYVEVRKSGNSDSNTSGQLDIRIQRTRNAGQPQLSPVR